MIEGPRSVRRGLQLLGVALASSMGGFLIVGPVLDRTPLPTDSLWALLLTPALALTMLYAAVFVHEVGHLVGGVVMGQRIAYLGLWPLMLRRTRSGRLEVRFLPRLRALGVALALPERGMPSRTAVLVQLLGGPVTSVVGYATAAILLFSWPHAPAWTRFSLGLFAISSALVGLVSSVPVREASVATDGARIRDVLRGGPVAEAERAGPVIAAAELANIRPREWDAEAVSTLLATPADHPTRLVAANVAFEWALDRGEVASARSYLDEVRSIYDSSKWKEFGPHRDIAWFAAVHEHDAARAREAWDARIPGLFASPWNEPLVEAAVLAAEGRAAEAERSLAAAEKALEGIPEEVAAYPRERIAAVRGLLAGGRVARTRPDGDDGNAT